MNNVIICCHCGAELSCEQMFCTNCGCLPTKQLSITFCKAKGSYFEKSSQLFITLYNEKNSVRISLINTAETVILPPGNYKVEIISGLLTLNTEIILTDDTTFETGIKLGFWKNSLFINKQS